ncbi:MAG: hypothetical protein VB089_03735 [Anaerolineaceae bacterium]|nr:hypothetical protein [Anaerolineaceae bacterium]
MRFYFHRAVSIFALAVLLFQTACSTATPPASTATSVPQEAPTATASPLPPTEELPSATATALPSATPAPTATEVGPLALAQDGFADWCYPQGPISASDPWVMAAEGVPARDVYGVTSLITPATSCTFVFTFNQAMPEGTTLEVYDNNPAPWINVPLTPAGEDEAVGYTTLLNPYIIDPPFWQISYQFILRDPQGNQVWQNQVTFDRGYRPELCWDGTLPDPLTMRCWWEKELHPWDPEYRTPRPEG